MAAEDNHKPDRSGLAMKLTEIGRKVQEYASDTAEGREWLKRNFDDELYDERGLPWESDLRL